MSGLLLSIAHGSTSVRDSSDALRGELTSIDGTSTNAGACGALWFLHVPKTGGGTLLKYLREGLEPLDWKFTDLYTFPCDPALAATSMADWERSEQWRAAEAELSRPRPRLLVHQHHCSPGFGTYLLPQLQRLNQTLVAKGCRLRLVSILREPIARLESTIFFNKLAHDKVRSFVTKSTDYMVKYVMFGHPHLWPAELGGGAPASRALGDGAARALGMFELLGRTEALDEFAARVASNLGFDVKPLAHWHATTDSRPYELSETDKLWMRTHSLADQRLYRSVFRAQQRLA